MVAATHPLAHYCSAWVGKIQLARQSPRAEEFRNVGHQCQQFYAASVDFMWRDQYLSKYIGGNLKPKFRITLNKAFELVSIFGPAMFWRHPARVVKPRPQLKLPRESLELLQNNPAMAELFLSLEQENSQQRLIDGVTAQLIQLYLNYTPGETPGGGLSNQGRMAATEALIKGASCMWVQPYRQPKSNRTLTGCFHDSIDNLLIDPDANTIQEATVIYRKRVMPHWKAERMFQLPDGSLEQYAVSESRSEQGEIIHTSMEEEHASGKTHKLVTFHEVFSKCGVGGRLAGMGDMTDELNRVLDEVVGDFAYLAVLPGCPYPLNAPSHRLHDATAAEIAQMFAWPVPYWMDGRWPVSVLSFYHKPNSPWPVAPMAPALGPLTFINILFSALCSHVWQTHRTLIAVKEGTSKTIEQQVRSGNDLEVIRLAYSQGGIGDNVGFLTYPQLNADVFAILDRASAIFDRNSGLTELLYGLNPGGTQSRTAEDAATKRQMVSVRPDYMATRIEDWQTEVAEMERLCAARFVRPRDLQGFMGPTEQYLWDRLISRIDFEEVARGMRATVMSNSTRRPDKARDVANINQILPVLFPPAMQLGTQTGQFDLANSLIDRWGKAMDEDTSDMHLELPPPLPNPEAEAAAQQEQEAAEIQRQSHEQHLQQRQESHDQKMRQNMESHDFNLRTGLLKTLLAAGGKSNNGNGK